MISSGERKLALSGWLQENDKDSFNVHLKLQKFLFLYECACKVNNDSYDFSGLQGWVKGPVFSDVWSDYHNEKEAFSVKCGEVYENKHNHVDDNRAKSVDFLVKTSTEEELSEITHQMDIWKEKSDYVSEDGHGDNLDEEDFSSKDSELIKTIINMYPPEMVDENTVWNIRKKNFVIPNDDFNKLSDKQKNVLEELSFNDDLHNPVYVNVDKEGVLLVD